MYKVITCLMLIVIVTQADPGIFGEPSFGPLLGHGIPAPVFSAPAVIKSPVIAPAPIIAPAPVFAPAPIYKAIPAPIIKAVAPATSYATVTQVHVTHPAVVKTIVAPQPIVKTLAYPAYAHGFH